jgi:hypothetical protein
MQLCGFSILMVKVLVAYIIIKIVNTCFSFCYLSVKFIKYFLYIFDRKTTLLTNVV